MVDITGFSIDGSFSSYPDGSRAKFEVFCPRTTSYQFLIPYHRYLFKKTLERKTGTKESIITKLQIDISAISQDILQLTEFNIHNLLYKLTEERANFIIKLIKFRYTKLRKMFNV